MEDYRMCTIIPLDNQNNSGQKAVFSTDKLWPQNKDITIGFIGTGENVERTHYYFSSDCDPLQYTIQNGTYTTIEIIKKVVNERIQPLVNLNFKFVDDLENTDIRISFEKGGSSSALGTNALYLNFDNNPTMNFAWISVSTILHEFGHVIGMTHEHQSPNSSINWNKPILYLFYWLASGWDTNKVDRNIINQTDEDTHTSSPFDPLSIMLYYYPSILTLDFKGTSETTRLSGYDVEWIAKTYPKKGGISPQDFYLKTYGISLDTSKAESDRLAKNFKGSDGLSWWKILLIVISIIIIIIIIAVTIKKFYKTKKYHYQRVEKEL
jgi:hypothetical protein